MTKRFIHTKVEYRFNHESKEYELIRDEGYLYDGPVALVGGDPVLEHTDWAFYNDGTEAGSTIIGTKNTNPTLEVDTIYLYRAGIHETAGVKWNNGAVQLQYNHNGGGWNDVNATSSVVQSVATANIADGDDTTQRMTSFTYISTNGLFDEVDGKAEDSRFDPNTSGAEALFSIQILSGDVADNDTIVLKVVNGLTTLDFDTYNQTDPTITVNEGAGDISATRTETITVADSTPVVASVSGITASESITVADSPTINLAGLENPLIDEAETISVTDSPAFGMDWTLSATEAVTVADVPTAGLYTGVTVAVIIAVADAATLVSESEISAVQTISVADVSNISVSGGNISASATETVSISDVVTVVSESGITANESVTVTDAPTIESEFTGSTTEIIGIVDDGTFTSEAAWTTTESISVADAPLINIPGAGISANVAESISVSDSPTFTADMEMSATESISVVDSPTASIASPGGGLTIDEAESITLSDAVYDLFPDKTHSAIIAQLNRIERIVKFNRTMLLGG